MNFYRSKPHFTKNKLGVLEPQSNEVVRPTEMRGLLVPGLAFAQNGQRLGRGRAYYDRFLKRTGALRIGVCFSFQNLTEGWAPEKHDENMNLLITDRICMNFESSLERILL